MEEITIGNHAPSMERSDSSGSSSFSQHEEQSSATQIQAPVPIRPHLPSRKSSGTIIVSRDSSAVDSAQIKPDPDDIRAMSPRRTSEDIEALSKEAKSELKEYVSLPPIPSPRPLAPKSSLNERVPLPEDVVPIHRRTTRSLFRGWQHLTCSAGTRKHFKNLLSPYLTASRPSGRSTISWTTTTSSYKNTLGI